MNILLSNDDGVLAYGLKTLYQELSQIADVVVVAPDRNRSASSNSLSLEAPLRINQHDNGFYAVNGTPTDCVHLGITGLLKTEPDMVVAGINDGANLGDDVIYSGTVAAAIEGRFLGTPAIAVSLVGDNPTNYLTAAIAVKKIIDNISSLNLSSSNVINVNVPDLPWSEIKGFLVTRLGSRHKSESIVEQTDPRGKPIFWIGPAGKEQDAGEGTDFYAINNGYISITPIHIDLTSYKDIGYLAESLKCLN